MSVQPPADEGAGSGGLTHLDAEGAARMVDVAGKDVTERTARARAVVEVSPATAQRVVDGNLPKGDAVAVSRIAGIQAAKRTHELIPLCHQLRLTKVDVDIAIDVESGRITVDTVAKAVDRTGVEMEALVAASVASLTLYDLVKAVEKSAVIRDVRLIEKTGGASGDYRAG